MMPRGREALMRQKLPLARVAATEIDEAFALYQRSFKRITRCAQGYFEQRDWRSQERDSVARLDLYKRVVDRTVYDVRNLLRDETRSRGVWAEMRAAYTELVAERLDIELAETFFNSITRRVFTTVGVDPGIEFVDSDFALPHDSVCDCTRSYDTGPLPVVVDRLLADFAFDVPYEDQDRDARAVAGEIERHLAREWGAAEFDAVDVVSSVFYRNKGAYIVGRIRRSERLAPVVIALLNGERGIFVDAVLLTEDEASIVFSYTHSYFHVDVDCPYLLVAFLKSIMPLKRRAELYISIGYNKHGKTELYRDIYCHLQDTDDRFEPARGDKGMVMAVFTMPSFDVVFKVIKDAFPYPKRTTRADVQSRYQLVFKRDRAGRLVDAQEFEHLAFSRDRFTDQTLDELLTFCGNTVSVVGDTVDIKHLYTERRLAPLNLHLREHPDKAEAAVVDYGQAIKDMAATNIFPGDLFMKNFGVTRHGRVVFYDYDELCLLDACNFRVIPAARDAYDDLSDAPSWFSVNDNDVFPEEFRSFLGLDARLMKVFCDAHEDLFDARWWREMQGRIKAGEVVDNFPYPQSKRLRHFP
jgi:isocitrate dehydrogenase kinase/phosphatase